MSEHQGRTLPPFPVDDFTLTQLEHALNTSMEVTPEGEHRCVGGEFTLPRLLAFLSGHDPERATLIGYTDTIPGTDIPMDHAVPIYESWDQHYSEHDVIRALIARVRELQPRTVETVEQLEALPMGSVIRGKTSSYERFADGHWWRPAAHLPVSLSALHVLVPATVLYTPEVDQ
ncbi:hypothetical protein [Mycolicibacterium conceptionense]|uniref:hypothetical protein n=1 Tax=Mycolicibacterium conceptionense TaxID=451644 RepID=UPI00096C593E|nr:hypothetical protein [Mycolicibacterium conceptionense]OMB79253.1 hypothetical protein A5743_14200 [Mycolicibacterium conceptionense]